MQEFNRVLQDKLEMKMKVSEFVLVIVLYLIVGHRGLKLKAPSLSFLLER